MSILFICGSIEPGKDGIGDYVMQLSGELFSKGHRLYVVALNDPHVENVQDIELEGEIKTLRIPSSYADDQKRNLLQKCINTFEPNWISLQFVLYAYHPKGLPLHLPSFFASIKSPLSKWEVMFHELWLGISVLSPIKHKVYGYVQRFIIKRLLRNVKPSRVSTTNFLYQSLLYQVSSKVDIVPLFSNIQISESDPVFVQNVFKQLQITEDNRKSKKLIVIFGSIYQASNLDEAITKLLKKYSDFDIQIIGIGKLSTWASSEYDSLTEKYKNQLNMCHLGILEAGQISSILQISDIGLACTPLEHIGKSGVYAAYKLHGLDVIISNKEAIPEFKKLEKLYEEFSKKPPIEWSSSFVANDYVDKLFSNEATSFQTRENVITNN